MEDERACEERPQLTQPSQAATELWAKWNDCSFKLCYRVVCYTTKANYYSYTTQKEIPVIKYMSWESNVQYGD